MTTALTGVGSTAAVGSVKASVSIPLTGVSASSATGFISKQITSVSRFAISVPVVQVALAGATASVGTLAVKLPRRAVALTGTTPRAATLAVRTPTPVLALTGATAVLGTLAVRLPTARVRLGSAAQLTVKLRAPAVALTGATGALGTLAVRVPLLRLALAGSTPNVGSIAARVPAVKVALSGVAATSGRIALQVLPPDVSLRGATGRVATLAVVLPATKVVLGGGVGSVGTLAIAVPMFRLRLVAQAAAQAISLDAAALNTIVMHTERQALTQYSNFQFNSYASFAGKYLGAKSDGIYELAGDTDGGTAIAATVRGGISDLSSSHLKHVDRVYVGYRATARMILGIITDEVVRREYAVKGWNIPGLHGTHVRLGLGVVARYWQFELRNDNGADFTVDTIELKPRVLKRRVGGRDA